MRSHSSVITYRVMLAENPDQRDIDWYTCRVSLVNHAGNRVCTELVMDAWNENRVFTANGEL